MKKYIWPAVKLTFVLVIICAVLYPLLIAALGKMAPGAGKGEQLILNGKVVGYANIGQKFTDDKYFWGRPSAVEYNAAGSGGSNKSTTNQDYLKTVEERINSFLEHNPEVKRADIPAELVTASGSGLDPDISPEAAYIQVKRIAAERGMEAKKLEALVKNQTEQPLWGLFGPAKINVLKLNIALDHLK